MGQSSSAIVAFGIDLGENIKFLEEFDNDFDAFLDSIGDYPKWGEPNYTYKDKEDFAKRLGVELILYGSYEYSCYILAVPGTKDEVDWGCKELEFKGGQLQGEARNKLKSFWDKYVVSDDLEFDEYDEKPEWKEPTWLFASMYG